MKILITNDDGIKAPGLHALVKEIEKYHQVLIAAPSEQRSACGHSVTLHRPLLIKEEKIEGIKSQAFSVDGTPADCVKIAVDKILEKKVDIIMSGINHGFNLGTDVIYSGTVSAAIEGAVYKIPSIAVSMDVEGGNPDFSIAAEYAASVLKYSIDNSIANDIVLNVNIPAIEREKIKGIKICSLGNRIYENCYIEMAVENGEIGYKLQGIPNDIDEEDTDIYNIKRGYVTITPLHYDLTNFKILKEVSAWFGQEV